MAISDEQQTEILRSIWNDVKAVKASLESQLTATGKELRAGLTTSREELVAQIGETNQRIDQTNERLDALGRRGTESEMRVATAITELAGDVHGLSDLIRNWQKDHSTLGRRVTRIEKHVGIAAAG